MNFTLKPIPDPSDINPYDYKGTFHPGNTVYFTIQKDLIDEVVLAAYKPKWSITYTPSGTKKGMVTINASTGALKFRKDAIPGDYKIQVEIGGATSYRWVELEPLSENPVVKLTAKKRIYTIDCATTDYVDIPLDIIKKDGSRGGVDDCVFSVEHPTSRADSPRFTEIEGGIRVKIIPKNQGAQSVYKFTITAKDSNVAGINFTVNVKSPVTKVELSSPSSQYSAYVPGSSFKLNTSLYTKPDGLIKNTGRKLTYSVTPADDNITIENGTVKIGKNAKKGTYTIKAQAMDIWGTVSNEYTFTVISREEQTKTISFEQGRIVFAGDSLNVKSQYGVNCDTAYWDVKSSHPDILSVKRSGDHVFIMQKKIPNSTTNVTITAYTTDGSNKKAILKVPVIKAASNVFLNTPNGRGIYLAEGASLNLSTRFYEMYGKADAGGKKIEYVAYGENPDAYSLKGNRLTAKSYDPIIPKNNRVRILAQHPDSYGGILPGAGIDIYIVERLKAIYLSNPTYKGETLSVGEKKVLTLYDEKGNSFDRLMGRFKVEVSKEGMTAEIGWGEENAGNILLYPSKPGTYRVTITATDGSNVKKSYTFKVVE